MEMKKMNVRSVIGTLALAAALAAFIYATPWKNIFRDKSAKIDTSSEYDQQALRKELLALAERHSSRNAELYHRFEQDLATAGANEFQTAHDNIDETVEIFSKVKTVGYLVYLLAYDKVKDTNAARDYMTEQLTPKIITPCMNGNAAVRECLGNFLHGLQENDNEFRSALAQKLAVMPNSGARSKADERFMQNLLKTQEQIATLATTKAATIVGVTIEVLCWRQIRDALLGLLGQTVVKAAASVGIAAADGPLPIGDIIAIGGLIWCGYDIYQATKAIPDELRGILGTTVETFRRDSRNDAMRIAAEALRASSDSAKNVVKTL